MLRHLSRYKSGGNGVVREYGGRVKDAVSYLFPDALHKYFKRYADPRDADGMLSWSGANFPDTCPVLQPERINHKRCKAIIRSCTLIQNLPRPAKYPKP